VSNGRICRDAVEVDYQTQIHDGKWLGILGFLCVVKWNEVTNFFPKNEKNHEKYKKIKCQFVTKNLVQIRDNKFGLIQITYELV